MPTILESLDVGTLGGEEVCIKNKQNMFCKPAVYFKDILWIF
jgi:hypothetical protein